MSWQKQLSKRLLPDPTALLSLLIALLCKSLECRGLGWQPTSIALARWGPQGEGQSEGVALLRAHKPKPERSLHYGKGRDHSLVCKRKKNEIFSYPADNKFYTALVGYGWGPKLLVYRMLFCLIHRLIPLGPEVHLVDTQFQRSWVCSPVLASAPGGFNSSPTMFPRK